jgi:hypothetical protein
VGLTKHVIARNFFETCLSTQRFETSGDRSPPSAKSSTAGLSALPTFWTFDDECWGRCNGTSRLAWLTVAEDARTQRAHGRAEVPERVVITKFAVAMGPEKSIDVVSSTSRKSVRPFLLSFSRARPWVAWMRYFAVHGAGGLQ